MLEFNEYVPAIHPLQSAGLFEPVIVDTDPFLQFRHFTEAIPVVNVPVGQKEHEEDEDAPVTFEYVPAAHDIQLDNPAWYGQ